MRSCRSSLHPPAAFTCGALAVALVFVAATSGIVVASQTDSVEDYGVSRAIVHPRPVRPVDAFPFSPLFGYPAMTLGFPQPLGHQVISTGPNGYVYRPITELTPLRNEAAAALRRADYRVALVNVDAVLTFAPDDGGTWLLRAQALFGAEEYDAAATSLHWAMRLLPREQWGVPVSRFYEHFASPEEYTARLRALEQHVRQQPNDAAGRFLLGYHYGYLGHTAHAVRELQAAQRLTADDDAARELLRPLAPDVVAEEDARRDPRGVRDDEHPRPGLPREGVPRNALPGEGLPNGDAAEPRAGPREL